MCIRFFSVTLHAMKHLRTYFILTIIAFAIASCTDGKQGRKTAQKAGNLTIYSWIHELTRVISWIQLNRWFHSSEVFEGIIVLNLFNLAFTISANNWKIGQQQSLCSSLLHYSMVFKSLLYGLRCVNLWFTMYKSVVYYLDSGQYGQWKIESLSRTSARRRTREEPWKPLSSLSTVHVNMLYCSCVIKTSYSV